MTMVLKLISILGLALLLVGCGQETPAPAPAQNVQTNASTNELQVFQVRGEIREIKPDGKTVRIRHEEIPGYMQAMTMDLETRDTDLSQFAPGDYVSFRMLVTENDGWIDQLKKVAPPAAAKRPTELPSRVAAFRPSKDVEVLSEGDVMPEYTLTNQLGKTFKTTDFRGNALAINFVFTSCPFPTYCPRMSQNFAQAMAKLKEMPSGPTNYQFLSVTIDPERDTPAVLETYAKTYNYDPQRWTFATGDPIEIRAITEHFGQTFWKEGGTINHNLRTIVLDTEGRLQSILPSNEWKVDELVSAMIAAAKKK